MKPCSATFHACNFCKQNLGRRHEIMLLLERFQWRKNKRAVMWLLLKFKLRGKPLRTLIFLGGRGWGLGVGTWEKERTRSVEGGKKGGWKLGFPRWWVVGEMGKKVKLSNTEEFCNRKSGKRPEPTKKKSRNWD